MIFDHRLLLKVLHSVRKNGWWGHMREEVVHHTVGPVNLRVRDLIDTRLAGQVWEEVNA